MLIILNHSAHAGTALARWKRIEPTIRSRFGDCIRVTELGTGTEALLREFVEQGERRIVAAGGDGTVNAVLQMVMHLSASQREQITLGAIGLGSSNDMHKPHPAQSMIGDVPVKLNFDRSGLRDIGVIRYRDGDCSRTRYWILNASVGVTADANDFFNRGDLLLRFLKRHATALAILYAALHSILLTGRRSMLLERDANAATMVAVNNLAMLKSPHVSGSLRYDVSPEADSGNFQVHCFSGAMRLQVFALLLALMRGTPSTLRHAEGWEGNLLRIRSAYRFNIECDGEIILTDEAVITIHPQRIRVAS